MVYPGHAVRIGVPRVELVKQVQAELNAVGCGSLEPDDGLGAAMESSVKATTEVVAGTRG